MTEQEVHEALCKSSDEDKMRFAIACQINGITPQNVEASLAKLLTGVQKSINEITDFYKYLS